LVEQAELIVVAVAVLAHGVLDPAEQAALE
jgi:hypothetical protein